MIIIPLNKEFKIEAIPELTFKIENNVLLGRMIDDFTWYPVTSFSIEDLKSGKCGCLECLHRQCENKN